MKLDCNINYECYLCFKIQTNNNDNYKKNLDCVQNHFGISLSLFPVCIVSLVSIHPVLLLRNHIPMMSSAYFEQALRTLEPIVVRNPLLWSECNVLCIPKPFLCICSILCSPRFQLYVLTASFSKCLFKQCLFSHLHNNEKSRTLTRGAFSNRQKECSFFLSTMHAAPSEAATKVTFE